MSDSFVDAYLPESILGYGFRGTPITNTRITKTAGGGERRNRNWKHPLRKYTNPEAVRCDEDMFTLLDMFLALGGPLHSWAFRDPMDFASVRLSYPDIEPEIGMTDQVLGVGDGFQTEFQLQKSYTWGLKTYTRPIYHPLVETVLVAINAIDATIAHTVSVSRDTGIVTITPAPLIDTVITAGFLFDVEVRFEGDDTLDLIVEAYKQLGVSELTFEEVRPC